MVSSLRDRAGLKLRQASQPAQAGRLSLAALRFCVFSILIVSSTGLMAADEPVEEKTESPRRSTFGLREFFKRGESPAASTPAAVNNRFVDRALQLLAEARTLEQRDKAEAALEMAQRAESVFNAAQHTTGIHWPDGEESPDQYIAALKRRTGVTGKLPAAHAAFATNTPRLLSNPTVGSPAPASTVTSGAIPASDIRETPRPAVNAISGSTNFVSNVTSHRPTGAPVSPASPLPVAPGRLLLDWGNRAPSTGITLTAGTQDLPATTATDSTSQRRHADESSLMLQQLGQLETWNTIEPAAGAASADSMPPLMIPGLINRPDGLADRNVAPIPTRSTDSISGSAEAGTTTIPVVPDLSDRVPSANVGKSVRESEIAAVDSADGTDSTVYDKVPWLLTQASDATSATAGSDSSNATVWQLATAQVLSTFLGVLFAVGIFLLIRAAAAKLFGTRLGVTFQFGSAASSSVHRNTVDESADVVPFGVHAPWNSDSASQTNEPKRAGGVANPEDFPFRIVGASNGEDEHLSERQVEQERDSAILKSVFEHNVELMITLDKAKESAA